MFVEYVYEIKNKRINRFLFSLVTVSVTTCRRHRIYSHAGRKIFIPAEHLNRIQSGLRCSVLDSIMTVVWYGMVIWYSYMCIYSYICIYFSSLSNRDNGTYSPSTYYAVEIRTKRFVVFLLRFMAHESIVRRNVSTNSKREQIFGKLFLVDRSVEIRSG